MSELISSSYGMMKLNVWDDVFISSSVLSSLLIRLIVIMVCIEICLNL